MLLVGFWFPSRARKSTETLLTPLDVIQAFREESARTPCFTAMGDSPNDVLMLKTPEGFSMAVRILLGE